MSTAAAFYEKYPHLIVVKQADVYTLEATDFERLCQAWSMEKFPNAQVKRGPTNRGDQGVDIEVEVGGMTAMRIVVQAKCWNPDGPKISIKVVNETAGAAVAKNARYAIVITTAGFTSDAKAQANRSTQEGNVKMTLLDGKAFWASLLSLPEYSRCLQEKISMQSLSSSSLSETEFSSVTSTPDIQVVFTNHNQFAFVSKIEQKIKSDSKLHTWLTNNGIACFEDFLFLSQQKSSQLKQFATTLSTGSKLALNSFLDTEIDKLRDVYQTRLEKIKQQVKLANTLHDVFDILDLDQAVRALFVSSDGVGQNFDEKDHPRVLCAIANQDFEKLMTQIQSETCRHELITIMNVITGKSQEELEGSVLSVSAADDIVAKFKLVDESNGKIKKVLLGPGMFSLPNPLSIISNMHIIGSGWGITVVNAKFIVDASHCKIENFTISSETASEYNLVLNNNSASIIASQIEFGFQRRPGDGLSPLQEQHHSLNMQLSPALSQVQNPLVVRSSSTSQHQQITSYSQQHSQSELHQSMQSPKSYQQQMQQSSHHQQIQSPKQSPASSQQHLQSELHQSMQSPKSSQQQMQQSSQSQHSQSQQHLQSELHQPMQSQSPKQSPASSQQHSQSELHQSMQSQNSYQQQMEQSSQSQHSQSQQHLQSEVQKSPTSYQQQIQLPKQSPVSSQQHLQSELHQSMQSPKSYQQQMQQSSQSQHSQSQHLPLFQQMQQPPMHSSASSQSQQFQSEQLSILNKNSPTVTTITGEKRQSVVLGQSHLNEGDVVLFDFNAFSSTPIEQHEGNILQISSAKMNKIMWLDDNNKLDSKCLPGWYPNCDLSETTVPSSDTEDDAKDEDFNDPTTTGPSSVQKDERTFPPVHNQQVLENDTLVSVAYGYIINQNGIANNKIPIQENGMVVGVDMNKELVKWCKICFQKNENEHWYSWQKLQNVELKKKHQKR